MVDFNRKAPHYRTMGMSGQRIVDAGRLHIGADFRNHFKPTDFCHGGTTTLDQCLEQGLGQENRFDCSGLVIASICRVLGIQTDQWPREYRHARQMATLIEEHHPSDMGDIVAFYLEGRSSAHLGILAADMTVLHASGLTGRVEEGKVYGNISKTRIIPAGKLLELGFETQQGTK